MAKSEEHCCTSCGATREENKKLEKRQQEESKNPAESKTGAKQSAADGATPGAAKGGPEVGQKHPKEQHPAAAGKPAEQQAGGQPKEPEGAAAARQQQGEHQSAKQAQPAASGEQSASMRDIPCTNCCPVHCQQREDSSSMSASQRAAAEPEDEEDSEGSENSDDDDDDDEEADEPPRHSRRNSAGRGRGSRGRSRQRQSRSSSKSRGSSSNQRRRSNSSTRQSRSRASSNQRSQPFANQKQMPQLEPHSADQTRRGQQTTLDTQSTEDKQARANGGASNNNNNGAPNQQQQTIKRDNHHAVCAATKTNKPPTSDGLANTKANLNSTAPDNSNKTTKLNGLKNRIIQRPPPLILDKVSNFYDNETQSTITSQSASIKHTQQGAASNPPNSSSVNSKKLNDANNPPIITNQNQQQVILNQTNSTANHKFWASLNLNAQSRNRNSLGNRNATDSNSIPYQQQNQTNIEHHPIELNNNNNNSTTQLGADLIITHRNTNSATVGATDSPATANKASNLSAQKKQQLLMTKALAFDAERIESEFLLNDEANDDNKPVDMSNNSEFDDSSTHGGIVSENDGGNLIGVDNPTPPASTGAASDSHRSALEEPPTSATSSRPRSNNPFLATDEELLSNLDNETNFHKRPASFMAATDSKSFLTNRQHINKQTTNTYNPNGLPRPEQQVVQEQFGSMHIGNANLNEQYYNQSQTSFINGEPGTIIVNERPQPHPTEYDQRDSSIYDQSSTVTQQNLQSIYGTYSPNGNYINYQPTISLDSESAIRRPPPSAIMQLPHWNDAIYELNNAILETTSVAGGAEKGEFIYIVKSGDIILELDQIKVSGFTLVEFNQLVESKAVHLLTAVQTKHSQGLTIDLKHYLNCSFPKNSLDKELQDLIRENIYRRTIPCTTRPPKKGEVDKVDYHFLTKEQFIEMDNRGMLLECGMYGVHYYGTMKPFSDLNSLSIYGTINHKEVSEDMRQPMNANHPAIGSSNCRQIEIDHVEAIDHPLYENQESLRLNQANINRVHSKIRDQKQTSLSSVTSNDHSNNFVTGTKQQQANPVAVDTEALPHGWERVIDQMHGTYYIDHNTQRTQYERPYEIELTKGAMGFGFTLVEADSGVLLVRSVIPGGPAQLNGSIRPGDILLSAVGVSVAGLQHTDIARLFSTFAVGDRIRLTFARSAYVVDADLVPDEYLFSNGTNGDLTVAVNSNYYNYFNQEVANQNPGNQILVDQEYEYIPVTLIRGDQGFGFTISDSTAGQKVKVIQNNGTCTNLKRGDILISLNNQDITKLKHKDIVERLKNFPVGQNVTVTVKRKKRFRSKTPMSMHTTNQHDEYSLDSTPQRKCKTPSLDGLMLRRSSVNQSSINSSYGAARTLFAPETVIESNSGRPPLNALNGLGGNLEQPSEDQHFSEIYSTMVPVDKSIQFETVQSIYGTGPIANGQLHYDQRLSQSHQNHNMSIPVATQANHIDPQNMNGLKTPSISKSEGLVGHDNMTSSAIPSETSLPPMKFTNYDSLNQINQYNNFMNNDKLVMMQMQQQQRYQQMMQPPASSLHQNSDYHHMPLYSNSDMIEAEALQMHAQPIRPAYQYELSAYDNNPANNYYANNEEIALQRVQYGYSNGPMLDEYHHNPAAFCQQPPINYNPQVTSHNEQDEYEYHQVDLDRGQESNYGIRLIGGSEVERAISIGSIVFGGAAHKNGLLKSGDEIISINNINVVGATHRHVVELISASHNRASLVVRRKKFGEACEVVLNRNMDEGFGFILISSGSCVLIGKIIQDSPADRCQQLHIKDRIIAVNDKYITPNMQHPEIVNMIKECGNTLRLRIIPADCYTVELIKSAQNDSFGFRMRGGSEYEGTPLYILRVAPNGLAKDSLNVGDQIIEINNISTVGMTHKQAATIIKYSDPIVKLKLRRNYVTPPSLLVDSPKALQKYNRVTAEMKTVNLNVTPNYLNDGSATSEQHSSLPDELQQQVNANNMLYNQSLPLYAT